LAKVREGVEVIVEQDHRPVAVIRTAQRSGRLICEILRKAKERNSTVTLDSEFGADLESIIAAHQRACKPPSWE
jgi:antitoxin (DNA-binding transcriptional repressor) of toxin-antitoxin stability system